MKKTMLSFLTIIILISASTNIYAISLTETANEALFSNRELHDIILELNELRLTGHIPATFRGWTIAVGINRVVVRIDEYNKENRDYFRRNIKDSPGIVFVPTPVTLSEKAAPLRINSELEKCIRAEIVYVSNKYVRVQIINKSNYRVFTSQLFNLEFSHDERWYTVPSFPRTEIWDTTVIPNSGYSPNYLEFVFHIHDFIIKEYGMFRVRQSISIFDINTPQYIDVPHDIIAEFQMHEKKE